MIVEFLDDECGAVAVDWVALCAGILALGISVVYSVFREGAEPVVGSINTTLDNTEVAFEAWGDPTPPSF